MTKTADQLDRHAHEIVDREGLTLGQARLKASLEAGGNGDVVVEGEQPIDFVARLDAWADSLDRAASSPR